MAEIPGGPNGAGHRARTARCTCATTAAASRPVELGGLLLPGPFDPDRYVGGRIQRVDLATGDGDRPLHRVRRPPAAGAERPRVRRATAASGSPTTASATSAPATGRASTTPSPTARRSARSCSRSTRPTASACRPTGAPSTGPRPTPAGSSGGPSTAPGELAPVRPVRPDRLPGRPARHASSSTRWPSTAPATSASATLVNGGITVISPDGEVSSTCRRATSLTTNICFGGPDLRDGLHHRVRHRPAGVDDLAPPGLAPRPPRPERPGAPGRPAAPAGRLAEPCRSASTSRRSAARRTRSTRTSWSARCWPTGWRPPTIRPRADLVVVNTCAFIEDARQESIDTILALDEQRRAGRPPGRHRLHGRALRRRAGRRAARGGRGQRLRRPGHARAQARRRRRGGRPPCPTLDLLNLPRPRLGRAVGLRQDRRGLRPDVRLLRHPQLPRAAAQPRRGVDPREVDQLGRQEIVLVAQDLASYGKDRPGELGAGAIVPLVEAVAGAGGADPAALPVPVRPHGRAHRRHRRRAACRTTTSRCSTCPSRCCGGCGAGATATGSCAASTTSGPASRTPPSGRTSSSAIPGETEEDHDQLLAFVEAAQLDWCGFFAYSQEDGTYAAGLDGAVPPTVDGRAPGRAARAAGRDHRGAPGRADRVDRSRCWSTRPASARGHREAPEIDGVVQVPDSLAVGELHDVVVVDALGPDLVAVCASGGRPVRCVRRERRRGSRRCGATVR